MTQLDYLFATAVYGKEPALFNKSKVEKILIKIEQACKTFSDQLGDVRRLYFAVTAPSFDDKDVPFYVKIDVSVRKPFASFMPPPIQSKSQGESAQLLLCFYKPLEELGLLMHVRERRKAGTKERHVKIKSMKALDNQILEQVNDFLMTSFGGNRDQGKSQTQEPQKGPNT